MKRILLILTAAVCIALCGCATQKQTSSGVAAPSVTTWENASYTQIDSAEAARLMQTEKDYIILDVRTEEEFKSGHIPNAVCIPNESITDKEPSELRRSKEAAQKLADLGYTNVREFGGIIDWTGETVTGSE